MALKRSIFGRLLISHMGLTLMGLLIVGTVLSLLTQSFIYGTTRQDLVREGRRVNTLLQQAEAGDPESLKSLLTFMDGAFDARIWVFDRTGSIVSTSTEDVYVGKAVAGWVAERVMEGETVVQNLEFPDLPEPMLSVVVPWGEGERIRGGIVLHAPVTGINQTVARIREAILWATLAAILVSVGVGSFLSWSISRPIKEMQRVANELGAGRLEQRVAVAGPDELQELAETLNRLAVRMSEAEVDRHKVETAHRELLANVSHELRTPLTGMRGFLEALQDGVMESPEEERKYIDILYRETLHLARLVDDLLDLSRLDTGQVRLVKERIPVAHLLEVVAGRFEQDALRRGIDLQIAGQLPAAALHGDGLRLEQILSNLAGNALKFTREGHIRLGAFREGNEIALYVEDTGVGIPQEQREAIFKRFHKVDPVRSRDNEGAGLGLAITRRLVEMHGGTIQVDSREGGGTTFTVRLPAWVAESAG